jgi:hypothetical protein
VEVEVVEVGEEEASALLCGRRFTGVAAMLVYPLGGLG